MNILERLADENKENYTTYLDRMKKSCETSSKHMIPFYTIGYKNILDVGCADGALMKAIKEVNPKARVVGIDLNQKAVDLAHAAGLEVYHKSLKDMMPFWFAEFDCIIFSSVLHEISSYADANTGRFLSLPIYKTLKCAYRLLNKDGIVIIRDGLMDYSEEVCTAKFVNREDEQWFYRFVKEYEYPYFDYKCHNIDDAITCDTGLMQEFMATWTWGEESWNREINEKFCILTEDIWMRVVKDVKFNDIIFTKSKEEYPKFLNPKIKLYGTNGKEFFPYMTCTIIAKK